jgi:hypothetical protein
MSVYGRFVAVDVGAVVVVVGFVLVGIVVFVEVPRPIAILLPKPRFTNAHNITYIAYSI